jgi:RNA polymerase sigma-B factor
VTGPEPPDDELFGAYRTSGDQAFRNALVERYAGLAVSLAKRFDQRGVPLDDLVQVAQLGVLNAVERFDPDRGAAFTTFATATVLGELKRHFRDKTWAVRVPRGVKELHIQIGPALAELRQLLGRSPTIAELAQRLDTSEDDLLEAMEAGAAYRPDSMDATTAGSDKPTLGDQIRAPGTDADTITERVTVRALMAQLPERERAVVYLRYFEDLTQAEIAARVGVSQVHVSRLLRRALDRLGQEDPR